MFLSAGGCTKPTRVAFVVTDHQGTAVVGAHVRSTLLDAGIPLPISKATLAEARMMTTPSGDFSDASGRVLLPVLPGREHLIEIERPVFGAHASERYSPMSVWVYRSREGAFVSNGDTEQDLRIDRVQ